MTVKWKEPMWYGFVLVLVTGTIGIYYLYLDYALRHGLEMRSEPLSLWGASFSFPLLSLPIIGLLAVSATIGIHQARQIATAPSDQMVIRRWRVIRAILWPLFIFAVVLYVPAIVTSDWFWRAAATVSKVITQLAAPLEGLTATAQQIATFNSVQSLAAFQTIAVVLMVLGALVAVRVRRIPVKKRR